MGPYFLFTAADRSCCDSRKSFSAAIDQPSAICLSFLIGDRRIGLAAAREASDRWDWEVCPEVIDWSRLGMTSSQGQTFSISSHQSWWISHHNHQLRLRVFNSADLNHNHLITAVNHPSNNICKRRAGSPRAGGVGTAGGAGGAGGNEVKIEAVKK